MEQYWDRKQMEQYWDRKPIEQYWDRKQILSNDFYSWLVGSRGFKKKVLRKTNKLASDFWWWTSPASPHRGQDVEIPLSEPCAKVCHPVLKLSTKQFPKSYFLPDLVHRSTAAPVAGTTDFLSKIWHDITTVSFMSAFFFAFIRKPVDVYKHF